MIPRPVRAAVLLLALSVTAVTLTACGAKKDTTTTGGGLQHIDLMLDYIPNADHAAVYAAQDIGAFRAAGLDVAIRVPSDAAAPLKLVAAGKADVAISYEPELLLARDKGMRVASFGAVIQKPLTSIMSLNGKVKAPKDLAHKKVGTAGIPYQAAYLKTIVEQANINPKTVHEVNVGFNLEQAMLSKKVDATLGAFWNVEGVDLQRRHKHPTILKMEQIGVPTYNELVLVARQEDLRSRGDVIRRFVQALARGAQAVKRNPALGADAMIKADKNLDRDLLLASIQATLPVFFPADPKFPWGYQNADEWKAYGQWMVEHRLIKALPTPTSLTNEFLQGRGL